MKTNPFCQPEAPAWLAEDPVHQIPRLLEQMLEVAAYVPQVYEILLWLKGMDAWGLIQERMSQAFFPDAPPSAQEATLTTFFAQVTQPMAEMIETLYVSPLLRCVPTVEEILRRMAHSVGACALPLDVVTGVCCFFGRRRASILSSDPIQIQTTTWRIGWQQTAVQVRTAQRTTTPFLLLVIDETTDKVLVFRSTHNLPGGADVLFALYDALVFSRQDRWHLYPPARVRVQQPLPPEMIRAGKAWGIEVEAVTQHEFAFLQRWERELTGRVLDPVQYLRLFDRACERAFGYAPFLAKQQAARQAGWRMRLDDDPCRFLPSLREVLPAYEASVGSDGALEWQGWHYMSRTSTYSGHLTDQSLLPIIVETPEDIRSFLQ